MPLLVSFERELKNKLAEKTRGAQSEEAVLTKSFKYFDLNDNGVVEPDEFAKAIEKIGIQIPTRGVSVPSFECVRNRLTTKLWPKILNQRAI